MKTVLVQAPMNLNNITFEPTLVHIGYLALTYGKMSELVFPLTFSSIEYESIANCNILETVYILGNLISVQKNAFINCPNLKNIFYYGTISVNVKLFSINPTTIRLCHDYKMDSFASYKDVIKEGLCPAINYIKFKTCINTQQQPKCLYMVSIMLIRNI